MKKIADVVYAPQHGERGLGDLYLPEECQGAPVALAIHGGGWNAMDKYSWSGVAEFMCRQGFAVYNINYRLLDVAPWPACGDDCLAAAEFLLAAGHEAMQPLDCSEVTIIGGSAGGHLTLMTGLRLPQENVRAMIAVSAPGDLLWRAENVSRDFGGKFFDTDGEVTDQMLRDASVNKYVTAGAPPVLCVHSTNDKTGRSNRPIGWSTCTAKSGPGPSCMPTPVPASSTASGSKTATRTAFCRTSRKRSAISSRPCDCTAAAANCRQLRGCAPGRQPLLRPQRKFRPLLPAELGGHKLPAS